MALWLCVFASTVLEKIKRVVMSEQRQPRIGVIGTGAIGGFYGLLLARAGFEVHFLLRSEYAAVKRDGLRINSVVHGELALPVVNAWQNVADMPACEHTRYEQWNIFGG